MFFRKFYFTYYFYCLHWLHLHVLSVSPCNPQSSVVVIESARNISVVEGHNAYFICCSGVRWTYEGDSGSLNKEIGGHPMSSNAHEFKNKPYSYDPRHYKSFNGFEKSVYSMRDDRSRLILRIDNASLTDTGIYRCNGKKTSEDAFIRVLPVIHFSIDRNTGLPIIPLAAEMLKHYEMFSSDMSKPVVLRCPLTVAQTVLAWEWREPIPPNSPELPLNGSPSRTVSFNKPGVFSNGNVKIGPDLTWIQILDPFSPESPSKLWCKFRMDSLWHNNKSHPSYYEIDWALYEPINVQIKMVNTSEKDFYENLGNTIQEVDYSALYDSLGMEKESSSLRDRMELMSMPKLIEGYPAKLACVFRAIQDSHPDEYGPAQVVSWLQNDMSLPQPPFHVNNSLVATEGVSFLTVRAYPVSNLVAAKSLDKEVAALPFEKFTCVVNVRVNDEINYTVTSNSSLILEVIRQPRIIDTELMSSETTLGGYVKLVCVALANGKPEMSIEFMAGSAEAESKFTTFADENVNKNFKWRPLNESYTLKIYRSKPDETKSMLHRVTIDFRGAGREHHGNYRCRVSNAAGQAQHVGDLRVRSEPNLTIQPSQSTYFLARHPLLISCLVTGYPLAVTNSSTLSTNKQTVEFSTLSHPRQGSSHNQLDGESTKSPVTLKILGANMEPEPLVSVKLADFQSGVYEGINATYSVLISHRLFQQATARCEYVHTDRSLISDEVHIKEATPPASPKIVALCAGPGAVIFGVSNPPVSAENEPTDKIVSQRVLFGPSSEFHSASNLASKAILLDIDGQPRSETVDGDEETIQEALENATKKPTSSSANPPLVIIPINNLLPGTNYTFEWSSANRFSLTTTNQFTTETASLGPPLKPTHFVFLIPTSHHLRLAIFLDDPCPYGNGGRIELGNILIRHRNVTRKSINEESKLYGYGNWSEAHVCIQNRPKTSLPPLYTAENLGNPEIGRFLWSGDKAIQCDLKVKDVTENYEVSVATTNRFGMSPWLSAIYRADVAHRAAYIDNSGSRVGALIGSLTAVLVILINLLS